MIKKIRKFSFFLVLFISGCTLDIDIVGSGRIESTDDEIGCEIDCRKTSVNKLSYHYLDATPTEGSQFLGFVSNDNEWMTGTSNFFVVYGAGFIPGYESTSRPTILNSRVQAIFHPTSDIKQSIMTQRSICLLDNNAHLSCWGRSASKISSELDNVTAIATDSVSYRSDRVNVCVIREDALQCWNESSNKDWIIPDTIQHPLSVAMFQNNMCVLHQPEGKNEIQCLTNNGSPAPQVPSLSNPTNLRTNVQGLFCVEDSEDTVCWGYEYFGQSVVPDDLGNVSAFAAGRRHTCAVASGKVRCWGDNTQGQLDVPADLVAPSAITAGTAHTCVEDSGEIRCWGNLNTRLRLLDPASFNPKLLDSKEELMCVIGVEQFGRPYCLSAIEGVLPSPSLTGITDLAISIGRTHVPVISAISNGSLYYWDDLFISLSQPMPLTDPRLLAAGGGMMCVNESGELHCWRDNSDGSFRSANELNALDNNPISLIIDASVACAVNSIGEVGCLNSYSTMPPDLPPMVKVEAGSVHACALSQTQQLFCWGEPPVPIQ